MQSDPDGRDRPRKLQKASASEKSVVDSAKTEYCYESQATIGTKYKLSQSTISRTLTDRQIEQGNKPLYNRKLCKVTHDANLPRILDMQYGFLGFYEGISNEKQCIYDETKIKYGAGQHKSQIRARAGDAPMPTEQAYRFSSATLTMAVTENRIVKVHLSNVPGKLHVPILQ